MSHLFFRLDGRTPVPRLKNYPYLVSFPLPSAAPFPLPPPPGPAFSTRTPSRQWPASFFSVESPLRAGEACPLERRGGAGSVRLTMSLYVVASTAYVECYSLLTFFTLHTDPFEIPPPLTRFSEDTAPTPFHGGFWKTKKPSEKRNPGQQEESRRVSRKFVGPFPTLS